MTLDELSQRAVNAFKQDLNPATNLHLAVQALEHIQGVFENIKQRTLEGDEPSFEELQLAMAEVASRVGSLMVWTALFSAQSGIDIEEAAEMFLQSCEDVDPPLEN